MKKSIFWFRRDLRLQDNMGLYNALHESDYVACVFVFDKNILNELSKIDMRVDFIWECVNNLKNELRSHGSDLIIVHDFSEEVIPKLAKKYNVSAVYCNEDYEPKAIKRDRTVSDKLRKENIRFLYFKDQAVFAKEEIMNSNGQPYTVFTHYSNAWKKKFNLEMINSAESEKKLDKLSKFKSTDMISLEKLGFIKTKVRDLKIGSSYHDASFLASRFMDKKIHNYKTNRDFPSVCGVSYLSVHNRFGTISVRELLRKAYGLMSNNTIKNENIESWINELIWRDFYFQILYNFPSVAYESFNKKYTDFEWENDMDWFLRWCLGETGYPLVDAAMKQLNQTGYMHNRLRMLVASFLTKHLLIDYRLGEQYFASKLLDFDLSANNGGWQWAASTGCDAQPYFRIFNPVLQSEKFDPDGKFIKKYLPIFTLIDSKYIHSPWLYEKELKLLGIELGVDYPKPVVDHKTARDKVLNLFKKINEE